MKILLAVHHFPPRHIGGAEWRAVRTAQALQARGHTVRAICIERIDAGPDEPAWQDGVFEGVNVRRLNMNLDRAPDPFLWEYDNRWVGEHVRTMIEEDRPDIFHLICGYIMTARALHVAQEMGLPTVVTLTDFWFICRRINMLRSDNTLSTLPIDPVRCARCVAEERRRYRIPGRVAPRLADAFWRTQKKHIRQMEARQAFLRTTRIELVRSSAHLSSCAPSTSRKVCNRSASSSRGRDGTSPT